MSDQYDLVVIGGGPGGSTVATLVAMQGHRVLLLERERFPIHKIGESLLPSTVNGICAMLGVTEELKRANFVKKYGGTFRWGKDAEPWTIAFSMSSKISAPTSFAYQVERMKFDPILLANAQRKGVDVREQHGVVDVIMDGSGRVIGVVFEDERGVRREARAHFVVDASGWTSQLARYVGTRTYSKFFRNVAVYGYFLNGKRLPPPRDGNIFCASFARGWFWYIPLSSALTSVGAVIDHSHAGMLKEPERALEALSGECEPIRDLLAGATRVTDGPYGHVRVRTDYSYCHSSFWKPGLAVIGDAACFIDPVFSSGVHLATYAGLLAARSINTCLEGAIDERLAFDEFERRYRREYGLFYDFLVSFYDLSQDIDGYYWSARKVLGSEEAANDAFIQLIAGVGGSGERLYESAEAFLADRAGLGRSLFGSARAGDRTIDIGGDGRQFWSKLLAETSQVQLQGLLGVRRGDERPLFDRGLIPSQDGFHWAESAER